jgi:hypothetical protein
MKKLIIFILFFSFLSVGNTTRAQDSAGNFKVYLAGPTVPVSPKSDIVLTVLLDASVLINAVDLEIAYPSDKLEFVNSDNQNSIVSLWQTTPRAMGNGKIAMSGGLIQPFAGNKGMVIKLLFKSLSEGGTETSGISFNKSDLYLFDGKGTKITASSQNFSLRVAENGKVLSADSVPFVSTPSDIAIEEGIKDYKSQILWKNIIIILIIFIIFAFGVIWVYNKRRRKI